MGAWFRRNAGGIGWGLIIFSYLLSMIVLVYALMQDGAA